MSDVSAIDDALLTRADSGQPRRGAMWDWRAKRISSVAFLVLLLWVVGKVLATAKDMLVSYFFGASLQTDAYFIASNVPTLVYAGLLASVPVVVLPLYMRKLAATPLVANRFASSILNWYTVVAGTMALVVYFAADVLVHVIAPAIGPTTATIAARLTRIFCLTFVFTMASSVLTTVQLAHRQRIGVQLIPLVNHTVFIVGVALFARTWGIYAAAVSAILGWFVQVPLQARFVRKQYRYSFVWQLDHSDRRLLTFALLPALVGVSLDQLNPMIAVFFGSQLGVGTVSVLSYAMRLLSLCTGIFIVLASTIAYPSLAHRVAVKQLDELIRDVSWIARTTLFAAVFVAVLLASLSRPIVGVVLQTGKLSAMHAELIAGLLAILAASVPFAALREVFVRALYALGNTKAGMFTALVALVATATTSAVFIDTAGLRAIAVAIVLGALCSAVFGLLVLTRIVGSGLPRSSVLFAVKVIVAGGVTALTLHVLLALLAHAPQVVMIAAGIAAGGTAYLIVAFAIGMVRVELNPLRLTGDLQRT